MVVLTVNGLFREFEVQPGVDNLPLGFVRTFVLRKLKGTQVRISLHYFQGL